MCVGKSFPTDPKNKSIINLFELVGLVCLLDQDRAQTWTGAHLLKNSAHGEVEVAQVHSSLTEEKYCNLDL